MAIVRIDIGPQIRDGSEVVVAIEITNTGIMSLYAEEDYYDLKKVFNKVNRLAHILHDKLEKEKNNDQN